MKKTDWFPPEIKPVHVGGYESIPSRAASVYADLRARWDGKCWRWVNSGKKCLIQSRKWRGLAEKPQP